MEVREYSQRALNSANAYWHYLDKHNKGRVLFDIIDFSLSNDESGHTLLFVTLADTKATKFPESLFFCIESKDYYEKELKIVSVSPDGLHLSVAPIDELIDYLKKLSPEKIKLATDLKFLVKRIEEWYKNHGTKIAPPDVKNFIVPPAFQYDDSTFKGTKEQADAILTVFEHPFTYIWGAPGTGKTRFVLSHALIHCIENICTTSEEKIIVTAPTNNAVDQTLFGILPVLKECGIKRNKVLRIGVPTSALASVYPDICEGIRETSNTKALKSEIEVIERAIANKIATEEKIHIITNIEPGLIEYCSLLSLRKEIADKIHSLFMKKSEMDFALFNLNNQKNSLTTKKERYLSFSYVATHKFIPGRSKQYREDLSAIERQIADINSDIYITESDSKECTKKIKELNTQLDPERIDTLKDKLLKIMRSSSVDFSGFISTTLTVPDMTSEQILYHFDILKEQIKNTYSNSPYFEKTREDLEILLSEKKKLLEKKQRSSTLESATIIAGTLDTIVSKYELLKDSKLKIKHIFIDEAAYAPVIKAMIAFSFQAPVTLLGDHMQLPPVCEMDREEIVNEPDVMFWSQSAIHCGNVFTDTFDSVFDDFQNSAPPRFDFMLSSTLNYTHRFGESIADILAEHVYTSRFCGNPNIHTKVEVINVKHSQNKPRSSIEEVLAIRDYLRCNFKGSIGILTPYTSQVELLKKYIPEHAENIMTVHASQGKEYDTVILSVCDTTSPWFTDTQNKISDGLKVINTAISRVKKELILVCDERVWSKRGNQLISKLIKIKDLPQ